MKVLLVNTYGHAGAANSCIRLHMGLRKIGIESFLLFLKDTSSMEVTHKAECNVKYKPSDEPWWKLSKRPKGVIPAEKRKILMSVPDKLEWFSFADNGYDITEHEFYRNADIVNLHWVGGFIDYAILEKIAKPIVWTLHDMNPFTGGCHYSNGCELFKHSCHSCPQLSGIANVDSTASDFSYKNYYLKKTLNLSIVAPSVWLTNESLISSLFGSREHATIPYGLSTDVFMPGNRKELRDKYGLPHDKKIVLFVSYKSLFIKRKGYRELKDAFANLFTIDTVLLAVGGTGNDSSTNDNLIDFGFVEDESQMAELYSIADLFVIPSLEDNLPNTVIESLLCGTPVVGFKTGGIPDMIENGINGALAEEKTAAALRDAIVLALDKIAHFDRSNISAKARAKYGLEIQAHAYSNLFRKLLKAD